MDDKIVSNIDNKFKNDVKKECNMISKNQLDSLVSYIYEYNEFTSKQETQEDVKDK